MHRLLEPGEKINLYPKVFTIKKIIGKGASSVTYLAESNGTEHILKECNPLGISMHRNETGILSADTELGQEKFQECLLRFKEGIEKQLLFRLTDDLKNITSNIQDVYEGYGTIYIDMTYFRGNTYDNVNEKTLYDLFRRIKALLKVINNYHERGYLHLDIKPQNIYALPETPELIMMFDFDSVVHLNDVMNLATLSYTDAWAAPEQKLSKHQEYKEQICQATDLFAIGEIVFYKIFGRHSTENDRFSFSKYEYSQENKLLENVNPGVFSLLTEFFHKTLSFSPRKRCRSAEQLMEVIDEIINMVNPTRPYLTTTLPMPHNFFIGREFEIEKMNCILSDNDVLFINGIGGIGKSELAKHYAAHYSYFYNVIVYVPYVGSFDMLLQDDHGISINNFFPYPGEKSSDYAKRKLRTLKELCDEKTLIIIDNFDNIDDSSIHALYDLGCKIIVTTRMDYTGHGYGKQITINALNNRKNIRSLFDRYYKKHLNEDDEARVEAIIDLVNGHTMTVELIAKQMAAGRAKPKQMLELLKAHGLSASGKEIIRTGKDGMLFSQSAYNSIIALFDISKLNEISLYILANLVFVPHTGMSCELFFDWCELKDYDHINQLIYEGWIQHDAETDYISVHPVICDAIRGQDLFVGQPYTLFLQNFYDFAKQWKKTETIKGYNTYRSLFNGILIQLNKYGAHTITIAENLRKIPWILRPHISYQIVMQCYLKATEIFEECQNSKSKQMVETYYCMADTNYDAGHFDKAEEFCQKALEHAKYVYGDKVEMYLLVPRLLGSICKSKGEFEKAEHIFTSLIERLEAIEETKTSRFNALILLLADLYTAMHQFKDAEKLMKRYFDYHNTEGTERGLLTANYTLCGFYRKISKFQLAIEYGNNAMKLANKIYGESLNINYSAIYAALGLAYMELGDYSSARKYLEHCLNKRLELLGAQHRLTGKAYSNLAVMYEKEGDFLTAGYYYQKTKDIILALYGSDYYEIAEFDEKISRCSNKSSQ